MAKNDVDEQDMEQAGYNGDEAVFQRQGKQNEREGASLNSDRELRKNDGQSGSDDRQMQREEGRMKQDGQRQEDCGCGDEQGKAMKGAADQQQEADSLGLDLDIQEDGGRRILEGSSIDEYRERQLKGGQGEIPEERPYGKQRFGG
ncbi:hypothetical protein [Neobacillus mesonae]|uniref:hypothetical protein n=1 Tax=Neobacillus mesonae TaxID=1193713 RepID=UPI002573D3B0|nr:hypothetical protein [Neobacillus mesonae]